MSIVKVYGWRLVACVILVAIMAVFAFTAGPAGGLVAFAAPCSGTAVVVSGTPGSSGNCDMSVDETLNSGGLSLLNSANATVTVAAVTANGSPQIIGFKFVNEVVDYRGSTAGWQLQASSSGITTGTTTYPLNITAYDAGSSCAGSGTCIPGLGPSFTALNPVPTAPALYESVGNGTAVVTGDYNIITDGSFTLPANAPTGAYTGTITITLANSY